MAAHWTTADGDLAALDERDAEGRADSRQHL
jgi:hypothetical protein